MARIVSFEGSIGAGKTTLVNFLSKELGLDKIIEHSYQNPFINEFYAGGDVKLETEIAFLLQHYSLLKDARSKHGLILADFSIEKDLVFARLNLDKREYQVFRHVYDFAVGTVGTQDLVIFLDVSFDLIASRIKNRARPNEVKTDSAYFRDYADRVKFYFTDESKTKILTVDGSHLILDYSNAEIQKIVDAIQAMT